MDTSGWAPYEGDTDAFAYPAGALKKAWKRLHAGDREPFPADSALAEAWRKFHVGDFAGAVNRAADIGLPAHAVHNKAAGIQADYLEENEDVKQSIYKTCIAHAEEAIEAFPDDPNAHYFHAYALGRYSQCISVTKALSQGLGGRIRQSLERTLERSPDHAEAHTAMGLYHAEVISKMGRLVGRMTYGASTDAAMEHFQRAIDISGAPIAWIEYGNGLYLLFGDERLDDSNAAYAHAAEMEPIDAMQALDIDYARASIAEE